MNILKKVIAVLCAVAVTATMTSPITLGNGFANLSSIGYAAVIDYIPLDSGGMPLNNKCGITATWEFENDEKLNINGYGQMFDWSISRYNQWGDVPAPWLYWGENGDSLVKHTIKSVNIQYGIVNIGDNSFIWCQNLTNINIPDTVTYIGEGAFWYCYGLTSINIPNSVTHIADGAFMECPNLRKH